MQHNLISPQKRIASIDLLRGAVMIVMALDHVRDYFHTEAYLYDALDLEKTSPALFFTRWITHFCAPVFMFLAGTSAFFMSRRKSKKELSLFLLTRGIWLIMLELTVINFLWNFNITFPNVYFIVIWALGISMIILAGLIYLPFKLILAFGIILVVGHNLLDPIKMNENNLPSFMWALIHQQSFFDWHGKNVLVAYPIIPWAGVMALGYCAGILYTPAFSPEKRKKYLIILGATAIALFIIIRFINIYGDPSPWSSQSDGLYTLFSFLKVTKYPPSLLYILMTLGPALLFLAFTENETNTISRVVSVYGRVPMFYYLIHILLIHLVTMVAAALFTDFSWTIWILKQPLWFTEELKGYGFSLSVVYLVWIGIVAGVYPLCKWYDGYKSANKEKKWLSYL